MNRIVISAFALVAATAAFAQYGTPPSGEWRVNGGDAGSTRYSPLDQINASNVKNLQVVWRWKAQNMGPTPQTAWEVTPLMVGGKLQSSCALQLPGPIGELPFQFPAFHPYTLPYRIVGILNGQLFHPWLTVFAMRGI